MTRLSVLYSAEAIALCVRGLAREIAAAFSGEFLMVTVLKGAFVFSADLIRALHDLGVRPNVAFVTLSSYGKSTRSSGRVRMIGRLPDDIGGRRVLVVDDILDTGHTLAYAKDRLLARGATEVRVCVLIDKPVRREEALQPDFVGFTVGDRFVVGYGIDYAEDFRDLPYLAAIDEATPR